MNVLRISSGNGRLSSNDKTSSILLGVRLIRGSTWVCRNGGNKRIGLDRKQEKAELTVQKHIEARRGESIKKMQERSSGSQRKQHGRMSAGRRLIEKTLEKSTKESGRPLASEEQMDQCFEHASFY